MRPIFATGAALGAACLALSACASGGEAPRRGVEVSGAVLGEAALLFAQMDRNGDYVVSAEELSAGVEAALVRADADGDGLVRVVELDAWRAGALGGALRAPGNAAFDPDFDRTVTPEEFRNALMRSVSLQDANRDGALDFSELAFDRAFTPPQDRRSRTQALGEEAPRRPAP